MGDEINCKGFIGAVIYSRIYIKLYILLIIISFTSFFLSLYLFFSNRSERSVIIIELVVLIFLFFDVCLRVISSWGEYLKSIWNVVNSILLIVGIITMVLSMCYNSEAVLIEDPVLIYMLLLRSFNQLFRILVLFKNHSHIKVLLFI